MKAQIKINYGHAVKGQVFDVLEMQGQRVTVDINGSRVDLGFSEVRIIARTRDEHLDLGHQLLLMGKKPLGGWREKDVTDFISQFNLPVSKSLMRKSINQVV